MKNKATFILGLLLIAVSVSAATRSLDEKKKIAEKYLLKAKTRSAVPNFRILVEKQELSVLGDEQHGFVIVNNDDQFPAVIGYSQSAYDTMPPAMEWYIEAAEKSIADIKKNGAFYSPIPPSSEFPSSVNALVTTTWDQGNPYNTFCPGGNGGKSSLFPTGCVATALAQIMKYHKYPKKGIGDHQYSFKPADGDGRILSANFGETVYDWNNMLDSYSKDYTDEQANAVATLMLHCGVAVEMHYTSSGSGSYGQEACLGLKKFFGYNKNAKLYERDYYTAETWMRMIYKELNQNRPIYYDGASEGSGGHAFVIDGYNNEGLVHVNWGWGGTYNGYYDIALLNPGSSQYSKSQGMILGICDSTITIPYESQIVATELNFNFYGSTTKRVSISGTIHDAAAEKFTGVIACILENKDTTIVLKKTDEMTLNPITGGMWFNSSLTLNGNNLSTIPDGTYTLFVGSKSQEDYKWQLVRPKEGQISNYTIVKNGTDITWTESSDDTWTLSSTTTTGINKVTINKPTQNTIYDLRGRNLGTDETALPKGIYIINGKKVVK